MQKSFKKALEGYRLFRKKYASGDNSIMQFLSNNGQQPDIMVVSCCDSRVDPALILQCDPGDLFVVRNVANIIPPYEKDEAHHGTSAALEFAICFLKVKHLILLGHSQCGGIQALLEQDSNSNKNDFITNWVSLIKTPHTVAHEHCHPSGNTAQHSSAKSIDEYAKLALNQSFQNCLTFPWIRDSIEQKSLKIHRWFFDVKQGQIFTCDGHDGSYTPLEQD